MAYIYKPHLLVVSPRAFFSCTMCKYQRFHYPCDHSTAHLLEKCNESVLYPNVECEKDWRTMFFEALCPDCLAEQEASFRRHKKRKQLFEEHEDRKRMRREDSVEIENVERSWRCLTM